MQSPTFNALYLKDLPELKAQAQTAGKDVNAVLNLLQPNQFAFASAAWFLSTQCTADVKAGLKGGAEKDWEKYITKCVGTSLDPGRKTIYDKAVKALGA